MTRKRRAPNCLNAPYAELLAPNESKLLFQCGVGSVLVMNESIAKEEHCNVRSDNWELRPAEWWAGYNP